MCQLLAMNCNTPTDICFSFTGFQARGGRTDVHQDGWGIAFFEGRGVRVFLDAQASAHSPIAELVRQYPIKSKTVVAHIRKATQGIVALENTHPFMRELWGRYWIFAHNGNLVNFEPELDGTFLPVGDTDSEKVFCYIMQELRLRHGDQMPNNEALFATIAELTLHIGQCGEFNFLFSNDQVLMVHASTNLTYIIRKAPFATAHLKDQDMSVDFTHVTTSTDKVAVIATTPLTENESWTRLEPGTLCLFAEGDLQASVKTIAGPAEKIK
ncbi:class II glutamine amidotransferase [Bdellovibrio bacteriovorus]|uniref:Class II glutamine amidotransferase n=1 Tax=Bdellovibrio bacteriovorus TaxID=959 RepID=A0A150WH88_BDEBC|nr:class II glutamine amidotransferase [Bdellovibrio bacteriovorus]KYG62494.1 class II glutamine amidotransferase [Bdellovibrio bacteriovorus]